MNLFLDSDMFIELVGLKDSNNTTITEATVNVSLQFKGGRAVEGQVFPTPLLYDVDTNSYRASLSSELNVNEGNEIVAEIVAEFGGRKAVFYRNLVVSRNVK